jgi:ribosomal-protein-alanine acetyltransferase
MPAHATRPARARDLDLLVRVEQLVATRPATADALAADLRRADRRWIVAVDGDATVGAGCVADLAGDAHVLSVGVLPGHRRRGVGATLVTELLRVAVDELGCARATLEVRASDVAARRLYGRCGFTEVGIRPGYYLDGEDAAVLWCDDPTGASAATTTRSPEATA